MANKSNFRAGRDNAALSENVELLTGQRGDGLDRAITLRELNRLGLATLSRIGGIYTSKNGTVPGSATPGVVDFPGKPLNVLVNGAFNTILIQWDEPNYRGHAYTEVWRAETDNLAVAVMIGTSSARMYSDPIGGDAHVYYWVRFVNKNDTKGPFNATAGTYGETAVDIGQLLDALSGQIAESQLAQTLLAKVDKIALIDRIGKFRVLSSGYGGGTSSVTNSLNETIVKTGARSWNLVVISKIDHSILFTGTYDVFTSSTNAQLLADKLNSYADYSCVAIIFTYDEPKANLIANLKTALVRYGATRATLDGIVYRGAYVLAGIPGIGAGNGEEYVKNIEAGHIETVISLTNGYLDGQSSASVSVVVNEITARIDADSAMASNISTVSAVANAKNKTFLQTAAPTSGMVTGDLWYDTDDNNKTYRYSGSAWVLAADARIATNAAAITAEQTARADGDSANATSISAVSAVANAKNKTFRQTTAPTTGMVVGDLWFDTDDSNKQYRYSGSAWEATYDTRISVNAALIQDEIIARANADSALATRTTTVEAYINSDITNLFLNPNFEDGRDHGFLDKTIVTADSDPAGSCPNARFAVLYKRDNTGKRIAVTPGDVYSLSMYCCASSADCPSIDIGLYITDKSGAGVAWPIAATRVKGSKTWGKISGDITIPANAAYAQFWVRIQYFPGTYYYWYVTGLTWVNGNATKQVAAIVQETSSAVAEIDANGSAAYRAMWAVKAQVGNITAGIGLMVSNGVSQVMVSASQFFVFDPNGTAPTQALLAVSNGAVVIRKALIESATIETVQAMTLTADYVVSGISVTSPVIVGGSLALGSGDASSYIQGGSAGFGKGGPYSGWGYGWHTIIYNSGAIYTDSLHASAGSFTGTVNANAGTFNNVTINENCDVKGTIYANKIVGDVAAVVPISKNTTYTVASSPKARTLLIQCRIRSKDASNNTGIIIYVNDVNVFSDYPIPTGSGETYFYTYNIAANTSITFRVYTYNESWINLSGTATVTPTNSGSIY